jgi:hypothetical protein
VSVSTKGHQGLTARCVDCKQTLHAFTRSDDPSRCCAELEAWGDLVGGAVDNDKPNQ